MSKHLDDLTKLSIKTALESLEQVVDRALKKIETDRAADHERVAMRVRERKELAKSLNLDARLVYVYRRLRDQGRDNPVYVPGMYNAEIRNVSFRETNESVQLVAEINGRNYVFIMVEGGSLAIPGFEQSKRDATLSLFRLGESQALFSLQLMGSHCASLVDHFDDCTITAFHPDKWISDVIHSYEMLSAEQKVESYSANDEVSLKDQDLKAQFGLS